MDQQPQKPFARCADIFAAVAAGCVYPREIHERIALTRAWPYPPELTERAVRSNYGRYDLDCPLIEIAVGTDPSIANAFTRKSREWDRETRGDAAHPAIASLVPEGCTVRISRFAASGQVVACLGVECAHGRKAFGYGDDVREAYVDAMENLGRSRCEEDCIPCLEAWLYHLHES